MPVIKRSVFDPAMYLESNPDVVSLGGDPLQHWLTRGHREEATGIRPNWRAPRFDEAFYRAIYPDVCALIEAGEFTSGADHWFVKGKDEITAGTRQVADGFVEAKYLMDRPDVAIAIRNGQFRTGYDHWLRYGRDDAGQRVAYATTIRQHVANTPRLLTSEKVASWEKNGFVVLEGLISPEHCDRINDAVNRAWIDRRTGALPVVIDMFFRVVGGERVRFQDAPGEARAGTYKLNDLFMFEDVVRAAALDPSLCEVLNWVLGDDPVAVTSLSFERGSIQPFHTDTLYMPGQTADSMTATWIALEDVTSEAGPLMYYPGSHRIPLFRFSDGKPNAIDSEMPDYNDYMMSCVDALGLKSVSFHPKKGDVLIWHERLFHGGSAIADMAQTRKSLVTHYWRREHVDLVKSSHGGFYMDREPMR